MENPCKSSYKGRSLSGSAHKESAGTLEKWTPDSPTVEDHIFVFDPLNFPNKKFDTEVEAIQHSIKYGEWIIDHPLVLESRLGEEDEEDEEDEEAAEADEANDKDGGERLI